MIGAAAASRYLARLAFICPLALLAAACGISSVASGVGDGSDAGVDGDRIDVAAAVPDTDPPTVFSSYPLDGSTGGATTAAISVTFSEAMAPASLANGTFSLQQGAAAVPGAVTYEDNTVTLAPASALALGTTYTATITTAATDRAGNALAVAYSWSFTTDLVAPLGPAPVVLGAAGKYAIIAKAAITNVPTSKVTGDLALSPAASGGITGFGLTKAGTKWTSPQVIGAVFAADGDPPTPTNLTTAVSNMVTAYSDAAARPAANFVNLGAGAIGGLTLVPGLYQWASTVTIPSDITIAGAQNDVWIFQVTGDLMMTAAKNMILTGGARAKNVFWQVTGFVDLGATAHVEGIVISKTAITLGTGASVNGRLFAQTAVTLAGNVITAPPP